MAQPTERMTLSLDMAPCNEALDELFRLYANGAGVPPRVKARVEALATSAARLGDRLVRVESVAGVIECLPGHELLAVLVDLRAARRAP